MPDLHRTPRLRYGTFAAIYERPTAGCCFNAVAAEPSAHHNGIAPFPG